MLILDEERRYLEIWPFNASEALKSKRSAHTFCVLIIETPNTKIKTLFWQMRFLKTYIERIK